MKKLLFLLLLSGSVQAGPVAWMKNNAGGAIVITDQPGTGCSGGSLWAYGNTSEGDSITGCWYVSAPYVFIKWDAGQLKSYPISDWTMYKKDGKES